MKRPGLIQPCGLNGWRRMATRPYGPKASMNLSDKRRRAQI